MPGANISDFERAVEASRAELEGTLAELEARLSPGRLAGEALASLRVAGEDDPRPGRVKVDKWSLALVALAGAWLLWSHRQQRSAAHLPAVAEPPGEPVPSSAPRVPKAAE